MSAPSLSNAARVLARAFQDDPLHVRVDPPADNRRRALPPLFQSVLRHAHRYGSVLADADRAVLAWLPMKDVHINAIEFIRCGMWTLPASWSWRPLRLMARHEDESVAMVAAVAPPDAAYLWAVGVDPEMAGRGLGKAIIRAALEQMVPRFPTCMLKTEQPRNVPMYQHLGFRLVAHEVAPSTGHPVWIMRQELRSQR